MPDDISNLDISLSSIPGRAVLIRLISNELALAAENRADLNELPMGLESFSDDPREIIEVGTALGELVFANAGHILLVQCLQWLQDKESRQLCIRIHISPHDRKAASLQRLPWEALRVADLGGYIALNARITLHRMIDTVSPSTGWGITHPARVLAIAIEPAQGMPSIDGVPEVVGLERIEGLVTESVLDPDIESLMCKMRGGGFNVLHISGHTRRGKLLPSTKQGNDEKPLALARVAEQLAGLPKLQLVVLNACSGADPATNATDELQLGAAQALVQAGIPAIIAMRGQIPDKVASIFSRTFYEALATEQDLFSAFDMARIALSAYEPGGFRWLSPVLFARFSLGMEQQDCSADDGAAGESPLDVKARISQTDAEHVEILAEDGEFDTHGRRKVDAELDRVKAKTITIAGRRKGDRR